MIGYNIKQYVRHIDVYANYNIMHKQKPLGKE